MSKISPEKYRKNIRELIILDKKLDRLYEAQSKIPTVQGKVTGSGKEFPYIEEHITVEMSAPKAETEIKRRIKEKQKRCDEIVAEKEEVELYISSLPEGLERQILEWSYFDGKSQEKIGEALGYTQGRISQIIARCIKD